MSNEPVTLQGWRKMLFGFVGIGAIFAPMMWGPIVGEVAQTNCVFGIVGIVGIVVGGNAAEWFAKAWGTKK